MSKKKILLYVSLFFFNFLLAGDPASSFSKINNDVLISQSVPYSIITKQIKLTKNQNVLIVADGSFLPYTKQGKGQIVIQIDGDTSASNNSIIDWRNAKVHLAHPFNCISSARLSKGIHTIKLIAFVDPETPNSNFKVGKGSGMSILVDAAPTIVSSRPRNPDLVINQNTGKKGGLAPIPMTNIMTNEVNVGTDPTNVVTLSSGSAKRDCGDGDAAWGIFLNGDECIINGNSQWSVQDILEEAEVEAPMFSHSMHSLTGINSLQLKASELSFTYFENAVCYKIDKTTRLITLHGMKLSGKYSITNNYCNREEWGVFGSSNTTADNKNYPPVNIPNVVMSAEINIPLGHNGIVLFLSKFRLQADPNDNGGEASLWLNIDGVDVGTLAVQGFGKPHSDSSRTISASYLSSGNQKLAVGSHIIKVYMKAEGDFRHIAHSIDLPLIYFD